MILSGRGCVKTPLLQLIYLHSHAQGGIYGKVSTLPES